jgi:hypothetical protein
VKTEKTSADLTPEEYDELVFYCKDCHSLCILVDESLHFDDFDGSYCGVCGSANIDECKMGDWMAEEERRERKRKELAWKR